MLGRYSFLASTVVLVFLPTTGADGYGAGIAKLTTSGSDPVRFFNWMAKYLPVHCQDSHTVCNTSFACGAAGRGVLCLDDKCDYPRPVVGFAGFGIHFANLSARPYGFMDNIDVEQEITRKLHHAMAESSNPVYDSFMDNALVLYASSLDRYVEAFQRDNVNHLVLKWHDDNSQPWFSLIVQVSESQLILEIVANKLSIIHGAVLKQSFVRLPASTFVANNASKLVAASPTILVPLAVSLATSDLRSLDNFYLREMFARRIHTSTSKSDGMRMSTHQLPGANISLRLVQRSPSATFGSFTVAELERVKVSAHDMAHADSFCGVSKWYDNHFAYDQSTHTLDAYKAKFDDSKRKYHIFGDCKQPTQPGPGTNLNVFDPMGNSIQMDGQWTNCPVGGSGDSLQNPCSQGNCSAYVPSTHCMAALLRKCGNMRGSVSNCYQCVYSDWVVLNKKGCGNGNVVNFCNSTSQDSLGLMALPDLIVA